MDPYAAQWAHYGYAMAAQPDASAAAAYTGYYNYPGVQVTTAAGTTAAPPPPPPPPAPVVKHRQQQR